jgi:hypothetical protein
MRVRRLLLAAAVPLALTASLGFAEPDPTGPGVRERHGVCEADPQGDPSAPRPTPAEGYGFCTPTPVDRELNPTPTVFAPPTTTPTVSVP